MDLSKLTKTSSPLELLPELAELPSWGPVLDFCLGEMQARLTPLPPLPKGMKVGSEDWETWVAEEEALQKPVFEFVPEADPVRRYLLLFAAKESPINTLSDMAKRRQRALDLAGVPKREQGLDGWRAFTGFAEAHAGRMLTELLRETRPRAYSAWFSNLVARENLLEELRAPVFGLEDDKKTTAYQRKLSISQDLPAMDKRLDEYERVLFPEDEQVIANATSAALAPTNAFAGGAAEQFAESVK